MSIQRGTGQWSFIDMLTVLDTMLQIADFQMNLEQTSNDEIMDELQKQNKSYLETIIDKQNKILEMLSEIQSDIRR